MRRLVLLSAAALLAAQVGTASATIISGSVYGGSSFTAGGTFVKLSVPLANPFGPPNSVGDDNFNSNNLFGFDESQNIFLTSPLHTDQGIIPAGTWVASHYVFYDPQSGNIQGQVLFDSQVLGVITTTADLIASDYLAHTGVNYLSPSARGLESGDSVTIGGYNQILWSTFAASPGDYVRVITAFSPAAAVPEPSTIASALAGIAGLGLIRARRRSR